MNELPVKSITIPLSGAVESKALDGGVTVQLPGGATLYVASLTEDGDIMFGTVSYTGGGASFVVVPGSITVIPTAR